MKKEKPIYHIRLVNGDELISTINKCTKTYLELENPLVVDEMKNPENGQSTILLGKYSLSNEPILRLNMTHVITKTAVEPEIAKYYLNSLSYNKSFVDKQKLNEIKKVNNLLESLINPPSEDNGQVIILKDFDRSRLISNSSSSIN